MIYFRREGGKVRNGFNFYPLSDTSSAGVRIKFGRYGLIIRYSKTHRYWYVAPVKAVKDEEYNRFMEGN